jgi:hypothetical protein
MRASPRKRTLCIFSLLQLCAFLCRAHTPAEEMVEDARNFLAALNPEQRAKAVYALKDDERLNWDFVPHARAGLTFKEMTPAQRLLAHVLLCSGLSQRGYAKATTIMSLDQILYDLENKNTHRDPEMYYVTIFGKPDGKEPWAWRVEGHHLSVNFTVISDTEIASSPLFFGSNPGEVRDGPRQGLYVLKEEDELGLQLVNLLSDEQKHTAIFSNVAPHEIITGKAHKVSPLAPEGLSAEQMTPDQRKLLQQLVNEYAHRLRSELAEDDLRRIESAGWAKVHFAWAGGTVRGEGHYYRVQGPTFLLELDNTQNNANHIHTVWRDPANDFGGDLLRQHYEQVPHGTAGGTAGTSNTEHPTSNTE